MGNETCDDLNPDSGDGCSSEGQIEEFFTCEGLPSSCSKCGDGILTAKEECDDSNNLNSDGCSEKCKIESGFRCEQEPSKCSTVCGDGKVLGIELCDAGTSIGCLPDCSGSAEEFFCEGGGPTAPSKCSKGFDPVVQGTVNTV